MVCFRTGFAELLLEMKKKPDREVLFKTTSALDGRDDRLLQWITDSQLSVLIADNYGVEAVPATAKLDGQCCQPYGRTTSLWGAGKSYPIQGEDFSYQIFRKRNCCAGAY